MRLQVTKLIEGLSTPIAREKVRQVFYSVLIVPIKETFRKCTLNTAYIEFLPTGCIEYHAGKVGGGLGSLINNSAPFFDILSIAKPGLAVGYERKTSIW